VAPKFLAYRDGDHKDAEQKPAEKSTPAADEAAKKSPVAADGVRELYVEFPGI